MIKDGFVFRTREDCREISASNRGFKRTENKQTRGGVSVVLAGVRLSFAVESNR